MAKLIESIERKTFETNFLGKRFTCPKTRNVYEVDDSDRKTFAVRVIGDQRDDTTADTILCPDCQGLVYPGGGSHQLGKGYR